MRQNAYILTLLLLAASVPAGAGDAPQGPPPAPVRVATAGIRTIAPTLESPGTVISRFDARIAAELPGRIVEIHDVGERVEAGTTLVRIDDSELQFSLQQAQADVARQESRAGFLEREVSRLQRLASTNSAAQSQLEQTESNRTVAQSDLTTARVSVARIRDQLQRSRIPAPFTGVIAERLLSVGERASVGDILLRLVAPDQIEVVVRAPLASVAQIGQGEATRIWTTRHSGMGVVRAVVPFGDSRSHMVEVRIDVDPADWRVGESVRVALPTAASRNVLTVPRDALVLRREGAAVFRVSAEGIAERVAVQVGVGDGDYIEVDGELNDGDTVIVRGAERLSPGQPVTILENG